MNETNGEILTFNLKKVFYNQEDTRMWLFAPNIALNNIAPIDLIIQGDEDRVITLLLRIRHGIFS